MSSYRPTPRKRQSSNVHQRPVHKRLRVLSQFNSPSPPPHPNEDPLPADDLQQTPQFRFPNPSTRRYHENHFPRQSLGVSSSPNDGFKVSLDFGTTFMSVAYVMPGFNPDTDEILTIQNFPNDHFPTQIGRQVPTESWYPEPPVRARSLIQRDPSVVPEQHALIDDIFGAFPSDTGNINDEVCPGYLHGYDVQKQLGATASNSLRYRAEGRVTRMKLLLDSSPCTEKLRWGLQVVLKHIKRSEFEAIRDYLAVILLHTRKELELRHDFNSRSKVEVVICVPICWTASANAIMCNCVLQAMKRARFGFKDDNSVPGLFMVNEAEAAATFALRAGLHSLKRLETFILLDCGGGTVDAGTYRVANEDPLRLAQEVIHPQGALCGSSYLNQKMEEFARGDLLEQETELEKKGRPISLIIAQDILPTFEDQFKRSFNVLNTNKRFSFRVFGLEKSATNSRLKNNEYILSWRDMSEIFRPCLHQIRDLMQNQINGALRKGIEVDKVVLVGGFADSLALRLVLKRMLEEINNRRESQIQLIVAENNAYNLCATGVAKGAILRACDKENGPSRMPRLSYGVLRHFEYQNEPGLQKQFPEFATAILEGKQTIDKLDGKIWVNDTIQWIIKAGKEPIASKYSTFFINHYVFGMNHSWKQEEDLYVSEICTEDFYQQDHPKNKGKFVKAGTMALDLSGLKSQIKPQGGGAQGGKRHYNVRVRVEIVVIDRDLKFRVRYPATATGKIIQGSDKSFSLTAAFEPGTK